MENRKFEEIKKPFKVYAENVEQEAINQFVNAMLHESVIKGALMPDAHAGYSLPIGSVVATKGIVFPSFVGYDIGCGMCAIPLTTNSAKIKENKQSIFDKIYRQIPTGFSHNQQDQDWPEWKAFDKTEESKAIFERNGLKQLCSLGGGNHFIEIGEDETSSAWIIIHSGSRGIGHAIATHHMKIASGDGKAREGLFGLNIDSVEGRNYLKDLNFALNFALENRLRMIYKVADIIVELCGGDIVAECLINRNHNHAEIKDGICIHRKGATHAEKNMMGVIPGNMRDGSFIVKGLGNAESLCSSSHGAGRVLGRKAAKRQIKLADFESAMEGILSKVTEETLDESPFAYKNIFEVMELQKDLVAVVCHIRPILCVKG